MHFKLNWIFIDGIHFKRIENWLHNGSRKTQKHDVNLTLNECHRTIRYQKKGNELRRVFAAVGASSFFSSFKRNVISFFWNSLSIWWKKRTRRKKCWTWFYVEILIHGIQLRLILYWTLCHAVNSFATDLQCVLIVALQKNKNILSQNPTDHTLNLAAKTVNSWQNELRLELDLRAYSIKCAQCFNLYTVECRWATSGWFVWT